MSRPLNRVILWSVVAGGVLFTLIVWGPPPAGIAPAVATAGLVALLVRLRQPEVGLAWAAGITGSVVTLAWFSLHPLLAAVLTVYVLCAVAIVGFLSIHKLEEGKLYPFLFITRWLHTKVNNLDDELLDAKTQVRKREQPAARLGHFGWDFAFSLWPWRLRTWPTGQINVDIEEVRVITAGPHEAELVVNPSIAFRWSPDLRRAMNVLATARIEVDVNDRKEWRPVQPDNSDGTLTAFLGPWVLGALRNVIAQSFTFGGDDPKKDVKTGVNQVRHAVLQHLAEAESPFVQLGLLEKDTTKPNGEQWKHGPSARSFELELPGLVPVPDSDLAKAIGAEVVAARLAEKRRREGTVDADMEALKVERVGAAQAGAVAARIRAETDATAEQLTRLGRRKGLSPAAALEALTAREAAGRGGTTVVIPGLGAAAEAIGRAISGKAEQ